MLYRNYIILFIVSLLISVCPAQDKAIAPLVAADILQAAGLGQVWQAKLAVKDNECIVELTMLGDKVYALTNTNYFFCLNRDSGDLAFGMQLAHVGFPVLAPRLYEKQLLIVAGNELLQIDTTLGTTTHTQKFDYTVVCPAVRNVTNFYIAGVDKHIRAMGISHQNLLFEMTADNDSRPTAVLAANDSMVFTTDKGNVICTHANNPQRRWRYDTGGKITTGMVSDNNELYLASEDTKMYKLKTSTGRLMWKCQLGGIAIDSPRVTGDVVYQSVADRGVIAINKETGLPQWTVDDGIDLLAQINGKAYIMTNKRTVAVVDTRTHKQFGTINFAQASLYAENTVDGRIYVGDKAGRVTCIAAAK